MARDVAARAVAQAPVPLALVEIITLPDLGQRVILRFGTLGQRRLTMEEADTIEPRLRELVGSNYWATVIGSDLEGVSVDLVEDLVAIDAALPQSLLTFKPTHHAAELARDADTVRRSLGLADHHWVWEIEMPVADTVLPVVRIVDRAEVGQGLTASHPSPEVRAVAKMPCEVVFLRSNPSFRGCLKAYAGAERQRVALNSYIARFGRERAAGSRLCADV